MPKRHGSSVRNGVGGDRKNGCSSFFARKDGGSRHNRRGLVKFGCDCSVNGSTRLQPLVAIRNVNPDLDRGRVRIRNRSHDRHLALDFVFVIGLSQNRGLTNFDGGCFGLRNVDSGNHPRDVDNRDQR